MGNQPICGDMTKIIENLDWPVFICFVSIKKFIHKIVTRTEILALASLQSNTNFKQYRPILGDMPKVIDNLEVPILTTLATLTRPDQTRPDQKRKEKKRKEKNPKKEAQRIAAKKERK